MRLALRRPLWRGSTAVTVVNNTDAISNESMVAWTMEKDKSPLSPLNKEGLGGIFQDSARGICISPL